MNFLFRRTLTCSIFLAPLIAVSHHVAQSTEPHRAAMCYLSR